MANSQRGEVSATIRDETYILRIATNEWCSLEDEHGKNTDELISGFFQMIAAGKLNMALVRSFFRASLAGSRPDITHQEAGTIMSEIGLVEAGALLGKVIAASMPEPDQDATGNPPKAATENSSGRRSSKTG